MYVCLVQVDCGTLHCNTVVVTDLEHFNIVFVDKDTGGLSERYTRDLLLLITYFVEGPGKHRRRTHTRRLVEDRQIQGLGEQRGGTRQWG